MADKIYNNIPDMLNNEFEKPAQPKVETPKVETQPKQEVAPTVKYYKHPAMESIWHPTGKKVRDDYDEYENEEGEKWGVSKDYFEKNLKEVPEPKHYFKLDKEKYKDVEETPYGFIYNVNGQSITDVGGQERKIGKNPYDPYKDYGFTRTTPSGEEVYHKTFDEAYNAIKNPDVKQEQTNEQQFMNKWEKENPYSSQELERIKTLENQLNDLRKQGKENSSSYKLIENELENIGYERNQKAVESYKSQPLTKEQIAQNYFKTNLTPSSYDENVFETDDGEEYLIVDENQAYDYAKQDIESLFDDLGLESFTPEFQEWILDNALNQDALLDLLEEEKNYYEGESEQDMVDYIESFRDRPYDYLKELGLLNDAKWLSQNIGFDIDKIVDEAIKWDGIAHFISRYDGKEIDLGNGLYAYRQN